MPAIFLTAFLALAAVRGPLSDSASDWGLATVADCVGPDGGRFTTEVVSLANGPVWFRQVHADGTTELLLLPAADGDGGAVWQRRDDVWQEANPALAAFVHGHDVHRKYLAAGDGPDSLRVENPPELGGGTVTIRYADRRPVVGSGLPFVVVFTHAGEDFRYDFRTVLPFRLAPGTGLPAEPLVLAGRMADLGEIVAIHERAMEAHRQSDIEALVADEAPVGVVSGRGRLQANSRDETRRRLGPYLAATTFSRYADTVPPVVALAGDGSLAWLACEMEAVGVRRDDDSAEEAIEFGYTWVEFLAAGDGRWWRVGNASSARP